MIASRCRPSRVPCVRAHSAPRSPQSIQPPLSQQLSPKLAAPYVCYQSQGYHEGFDLVTFQFLLLNFSFVGWRDSSDRTKGESDVRISSEPTGSCRVTDIPRIPRIPRQDSLTDTSQFNNKEEASALLLSELKRNRVFGMPEFRAPPTTGRRIVRLASLHIHSLFPSPSTARRRGPFGPCLRSA
jgi:hypothetical protein